MDYSLTASFVPRFSSAFGTPWPTACVIRPGYPELRQKSVLIAATTRYGRSEHDNVGHRNGEGPQRRYTILRLGDLAPDRIGSLPMKNPFHLVVVDEQDHRICGLVIHGRSGHFRETL
jgi:hypothetical protein